MLLSNQEIIKELNLDRNQLLKETKSLYSISSLIEIPEYEPEPKRKSFFSR